jgi:hypothetical protein
MLCSVCSNISIDDLIPTPVLLQSGVVSGARHHASYGELENASINGCELCRIIESSSSKSTIQQAKIKRMRKFPVHLKMLLQGNQSPEYQGGTKLLVACGGDIIANFESYVVRGKTKWLIRRLVMF